MKDRILHFSPIVYILSITTILSFIFFIWETWSWKFSYVGDEWAFYTKALEIINHNFKVNPFNMQGVYNENPLLGSIWQALFIKIFGASNFAWRLSNTILIIPTSIIFFKWLSKSFNTGVGLIGTILMQSSFYLANYSKLGVVNPQCFALMILSFYLAFLVGRFSNLKTTLSLGLVLGTSFYIYIGPLFILFIWPYLLPLISKLPKALLLVGVFFLVILPGLSDQTHWNAAAKKTILKREFSDNTIILKNIYRNFLLFYHNYDYAYYHFISGPYLDLITQVFATAGIIICLLNIKTKSYFFLFLSYLSVGIILGLSSPYPYPPTSRGVFLLPFGFIFAAIAMEKIIRKIGWLNISPILILIIAINIYRSQIEYFNKYGHKPTALILKYLIEQNRTPNSQSIFYISNAEKLSYNFQNIYTMMPAFGISKTNLQVIETPSPSCQQLASGQVLVLSQDSVGIDSLQKLNCPSEYAKKPLIITSKIFHP